MATSRKDSKGRVLYPGESQRKDGKYIYQYHDVNRKRRVIYAGDLQELRQKKKTIEHDIADGVDAYAGERTTLNAVFDRYIRGKINLKQSTRTNYMYMYDNYIRSSFGNRFIGKIKYSDVKEFISSFITEKDFKMNSIEVIHTLLNPTFTLAVRDGLIRVNPASGVMAEIKKSCDWEGSKREALTIDQQTAFINYVADSPIYHHWLPLFVVFLGTGGRLGEITGLTESDLDFKERIISINHNLVYRVQDNGTCEYHINTPKTKNSIREIPMLEEVYDALLLEKRYQKQRGGCKDEVDGYKRFIFTNRLGKVHNPMAINRAIKRIYEAYNQEEYEQAKQEERKPILLPHFTVHSFRHTFCTRYCENEPNIKVIQMIMGHADFSTTMDVYAKATKESKKESFSNLEGKIRIF